MGDVEVLIESDNGHDTLLVPGDKVPGEVSKQLNEDKWTTLKKKDGSTEVLTKADAPKEDDWKNSFAKKDTSVGVPSSVSNEAVDKFVNKFEDVESVIVTNKSKGG